MVSLDRTVGQHTHFFTEVFSMITLKFYLRQRLPDTRVEKEPYVGVEPQLEVGPFALQARRARLFHLVASFTYVFRGGR